MLPRLRTDADLRICILYEYRLGHSVEIAHDNLVRAFGARQIADDIVIRWFNRFRNNDASEYERPFVSLNIAELMQIVKKNPRMPVPELARHFGVSSDTIYSHLMNIRGAEFRKRHGNRELLEVKKADATAPRISSTVEHLSHGARLVIRSTETDPRETSEAKCSRMASNSNRASRFEPTTRRLGASDSTISEDKSSTLVGSRTPVKASSAFTEDEFGSIGRNGDYSKATKGTSEANTSIRIEQVDCEEKKSIVE